MQLFVLGAISVETSPVGRREGRTAPRKALLDHGEPLEDHPEGGEAAKYRIIVPIGHQNPGTGAGGRRR